MKNLSFNIDFDFCLKVFLLLGILLYMPYSAGYDQNLLQLMVLDYGPLLLFGLSIYFTPERDPRNYNILLVLLLTVVTALFLNPVAYPVNLIHLVSGCLLYYSITRSVKNIQGILNTLIIICLINIPFFIFQYFGKEIIYQRNTDVLWSCPGLMGRSYHLAFFITIIIPLLLKFRATGIVLSALLAGVVFILQGVAALLALFTGIMTYIFFKIKSVRIRTAFFSGIFLIIIMATIMNFSVVKNKFTEPCRRGAMFYTLKSAFTNPLRGNGLGSLDVDVNIVGDRENNIPAKYNSSFNQLFRIMYELGPFFTLILLYGVYRYFKKIYIADPCFMGALAAIMAYPMFHEVLRFARLIIIMVTVIALYEAYCLDKRKEIVCNPI